MNSRGNVVVYNTQAVELWKEKLEQIPNLINKQEQRIAFHAPSISHLEHALRPIQERIRNLQSQLSILNAQYTAQQLHQISDSFSYDSYDYDGHHHHHHHHHQGPSFFHTIGDIAISATLSTQINNLQNELNRSIEEERPLKGELREHRKSVEEAQKEIECLKEDRGIITKHLKNAELFLNDLRTNPEQLFRLFMDNIRDSFHLFDDERFEQEIKVRLCLNEFDEKLNRILEEDSQETNTSLYANYLNSIHPNKREWQIKYLQLCGFLWDMKHQIGHLNFDFDALLDRLLEAGHIADNGSLPEEIQSSDTCLNQFYKIKNKHSELYDISETACERLNEIEEKRYKTALNLVKSFAERGATRLHQEARYLALEVDRKITKKRKASQPKPNLKLYTRVLNQGYDYVTCDPQDPRAKEIQRNFASLADYVSGIPSSSKKVWAVMAGILGLTLIGVSVALAGPSFGFSSIGIGLGAGLLTEFLAVTTGCVGVGLTGFGLGLFHHGMRKGVSKSIVRLDEVKKTCEENPGYRPAAYSPAF